MVRRRQWWALLCAAGSLTSCTLVDQAVPIRVESAVFVCGPWGRVQEAAGLRLGVVNLGGKPLREVKVDFFLWKEGMGYPEPGRNHFIRSVPVHLGPGESGAVHVCLDSAFWFIPAGPLEVERMFIPNLVYEDGTTWSDPWGIHVYPGTIEVEDA